MYRLEDLNLRPTEYESVVLPTELKRFFLVVEVGFEPTNRISAIADLAGRWVKPLPHSTILFLRLHSTIPYNSTRSVFTSHSLIIDLWLPTVTSSASVFVRNCFTDVSFIVGIFCGSVRARFPNVSPFQWFSRPRWHTTPVTLPCTGI